MSRDNGCIVPKWSEWLVTIPGFGRFVDITGEHLADFGCRTRLISWCQIILHLPLLMKQFGFLVHPLVSLYPRLIMRLTPTYILFSYKHLIWHKLHVLIMTLICGLRFWLGSILQTNIFCDNPSINSFAAYVTIFWKSNHLFFGCGFSQSIWRNLCIQLNISR